MQNLKRSLEDLLKEGEFLPDDSDVKVDEECINAVDQESDFEDENNLFAGPIDFKNQHSPETQKGEESKQSFGKNCAGIKEEIRECLDQKNKEKLKSREKLKEQ